jgi:cardiolipin synthase
VPDQEQVSTRIVTIPNVISFVRLMAIPVFLFLVWAERDVAGLIVLVVAVLTDFVDGAVARKLNQVSKLGQFLDPLADRLFIAAAVVALLIRDVIPLWLVVVVMLRDALLGVGALVMSRWGITTLPVKWLGKWATFALLFALPLFLLGAIFETVGQVTDPLAWAVVLAGTALYWWVGFWYLFDAVRIARTRGREDVPQSANL